MEANKKKALINAGSEAALEALKEIPFVGSLIESIRTYHESIEEQQREEFIAELQQRMNRLETNSEWYKSSDGQEFVKKVIATSLNAEYADKLEYLANILVNGSTLGSEQAKKLKFVEMVRQLSKAALHVLVTTLQIPTGSGEVLVGPIAEKMNWEPALVDSCIQELRAAGAFSSVMTWSRFGDEIRPFEQFSDGRSGMTEITREFARFISNSS